MAAHRQRATPNRLPASQGKTLQRRSSTCWVLPGYRENPSEKSDHLTAKATRPRWCGTRPHSSSLDGIEPRNVQFLARPRTSTLGTMTEITRRNGLSAETIDKPPEVLHTFYRRANNVKSPSRASCSKSDGSWGRNLNRTNSRGILFRRPSLQRRRSSSNLSQSKLMVENKVDEERERRARVRQCRIFCQRVMEGERERGRGTEKDELHVGARFVCMCVRKS